MTDPVFWLTICGIGLSFYALWIRHDLNAAQHELWHTIQRMNRLEDTYMQHDRLAQRDEPRNVIIDGKELFDD